MNMYLAMFAIVVISVAFGMYNFNRSAAWETTSGVVFHSEMTRVTRPSVGDNITGLIDYELRVGYQYNVKGKDYRSFSLMAGVPSIVGEKREADDILARYPVGETVAVFFDPKKPAKSALITSKNNGLMLVVLVVFLFVIGASIFFAMRLLSSD